MKYQTLNENIIRLVGGRDNISAVVHCMTRLRFTLKDRSKAQTEEIKAMDGIIDVVSNDVAYQIIIGTHVSEVHEELVSMLGISVQAPDSRTGGRKNPFKAALDLVSESMTPLLEPIIAAGMLAGLLSLVSLTGLVSADSPTYIVLDSIRGAVFFFLPVFMAMACAKRLNASPYLAVALAATLLSSSINGVEGLSVFGIPLPAITYSSSFIPILLAVWFMGYVQAFLKKIIPNLLQYFLIPVFTLVITLPVTLMFFGPIGTWIGEGISFVCTFLANTLGNWSVVAFYAAIQPFLIMMGAGNFIMPVVMAFLAEMGYDPLFLAACTISDIAVGGAMFGYFLRSKDPRQKELFGTVSFSAILGCTEPAVFGAFVKYRRPFLAVIIGGGLGGLFAGLMEVKTYTMAWGLAGLPSYIGVNDFNNFYYMIAAVIIGFVAAAIAGFILCVPEGETQDTRRPLFRFGKARLAQPDGMGTDGSCADGSCADGSGAEGSGAGEGDGKTAGNKNLHKECLSAVAIGQVVQLSQVKDMAFSSGAMGKGIAIKPACNQVHAPVSGQVACLFPTKHAIGIKTDSGVELLIHIGIDTVQLDGKYFTAHIEQGQRVERGQLLVEADMKAIEAEGYDTTIMVIITNTAQFLDVIPAVCETIRLDEECLSVVF